MAFSMPFVMDSEELGLRTRMRIGCAMMLVGVVLDRFANYKEVK